MYDLMIANCLIVISPYAAETRDWEPATFYMDRSGIVWCKSRELGVFPREDMNRETFNAHILRMIDEGCQISVIPGNVSGIA